MRLKGFIGPTYQLQTVNQECQRCVNLYPQLNELQTAADGEIGSLVSTPGKRLLTTCGNGPIRALWTVSSTGDLVCVSGNEVYRIASDWSTTLLGTILTNEGPVSITDSGPQVMFVDGPNGYIITVATWELARITDSGFQGADTVTFQDSYFIANITGTGEWAISGGYDGFSWNAADFLESNNNGNKLVAVISNQRQVWTFGTQAIDVYWDSGAVDFPFSRIDGAYIEYGCVAGQTVKRYSNTLIWLGGGTNANGIVWMAQGYVPKRISNHAVEIAIQSYENINEATAWIYQENGHAFYCLNFPNADRTWVYDISTGQWHERCALGSDGNLYRDRAEVHALAYATHVVGDYQNSNIYALDDSVYTDNGSPLVRLRRATHLSADNHRVYFYKFQLMALVGQGLDGHPVVGTNPTAHLRYSDDFGHSWSYDLARDLGKIGEYSHRVMWRRLGQARNRVFEVSCSDPVPLVMLGAEVDLVPGVS